MIVVIPAYEPAEQMLALIEDFKIQTDYSIVVVNDGSGKAYDDVFAKLPKDVVLLTHDINLGRGQALKTAFTYITEHYPSSEGIVTVDADGQHLVADTIRVCNKLLENPGALIIGARRFVGNVPFRSRAGNKITQYVFAAASGVKLTDTQTGLRAFDVAQIPVMLALKGERYEFEMNMLLNAAENGIPILEVPIETVYIDGNSSSHFNSFRDSVKIYMSICKFVCSSLFAYGIDVAALFLLKLLTRSIMGQSLSLLVSVVGARIISSICNFLINKKFVFKNKQQGTNPFLKYYLLALVILCLNYTLLWLLSIALFMPLLWAKIVTELILFSLSFLGQRLFVFNRKRIRP